ncbi:MAG: MmcQ/YjbR family DNA-binding protein [Dehalococcoidia bacterium]
MATFDDVRRIALALPDTEERDGHQYGFGVRRGKATKGFVWVGMDRSEPRARIPRDDVIVIRVANLDEKDAMLSMDPAKFFTEPHYNGYPAVLVRLDAINEDELEDVLTEAWRCQASKTQVGRLEAERG